MDSVQWPIKDCIWTKFASFHFLIELRVVSVGLLRIVGSEEFEPNKKSRKAQNWHQFAQLFENLYDFALPCCRI